MRESDGWVPLKDILQASGYKSDQSTTKFKADLEGLVDFKAVKFAGGKPAWAVRAQDAQSVLDVLKERFATMSKNSAAARLAREARKAVPMPHDVPRTAHLQPGEPSREAVGFRHPKGDEQELTGLVRRVKILCQRLAIQELTFTKDARADGGYKCVKIQIQETEGEIK